MPTSLQLFEALTLSAAGQDVGRGAPLRGQLPAGAGHLRRCAGHVPVRVQHRCNKLAPGEDRILFPHRVCIFSRDSYFLFRM